MSKSNQNESLPPLIDCINAIKSVGFDRSSHGSRQLAQLFTSCLGFLSYIHRDRQCIAGEGHETLPPSHKIPAMHALLMDKSLFKIFLTMLSSKCTDVNNVLAKSNRGRSASFGQVKINAKPVQSTTFQNRMSKNQLQQQQQQQQQLMTNRKRALSISSAEDVAPFQSRMAKNQLQQQQQLMAKRKRALSSSSAEDLTPNKSMKLMRSPMQQGKEFNKVAPSNGPALPALAGPMHSSLDINFSVLAAVVFYSVFQYLEQWPAVFVRLYAEDKFGLQLWVNDERCSLFVENLATVLGKSSSFDEKKTELFVKSFDSHFADGAKRTDSEQHQFMNLDQQSRINNGIHQSDDVSSASESGDEECVFEGAPRTVPMQNRNGTSMRKSPERDDSSSSGEEQSEDEIMVSISSSNPNGSKLRKSAQIENHSESGSNISTVPSQSSQALQSILRSRVSPIPSQGSQDLEISQWWVSENIQREQICGRFFGANKHLAHEMIGSALSSRLGEKVKQNSGLLATLPDFTLVPQVRGLVASQLEKWLQSPALSGLARTLFSKLVKGLENVNPPLPEDVSTIQTILSMTLKANQFHTHVENVIEIVRTVPTLAVCRQIVLHLFTEELKDAEENTVKSSNEKSQNMDMLKALLLAVPRDLGHDAIASSILALISMEHVAVDRWSRVALLCGLLRKVVNLFTNTWYDGQLMVNFILGHDHNFSIVGLDIIARIVFEGVILMVPTSMIDDTLDSQSQLGNEFSIKLLEMKKRILRWYLKSFEVLDAKKGDQFKTREPNVPIFESILDSETKEIPLTANLKILHCLLFLSQPDSMHLLQFLNPNIGWEMEDSSRYLEETRARATICIKHGRVVDDDLIRIILEAARKKNGTTGPVAAIELIEFILYNCRDEAEGSIRIKDLDIVWSLYSLAEHVLDRPNEGEEIPRIACPGLWWRVTAISLILCGKSPGTIGASMWKEHPTLRALMKMAVSSKFRFPTVDCDDKSREMMKSSDYQMREKESEIVEMLFLTPEMRASNKVDNAAIMDEAPTTKGTRTSARQRAKHHKLLLIEREKELARQQAEKLRIKRLLKDAQKSVMLWDPRSEARKPPKKSVLMLFSVSNIFDLAKSFIASTSPDYIIDTIGSTNRESIQRAYDWLIPIISSFPSVIIRLPPSASCFLLLRAYGEGGGSSTNELLKLSSPLLTHVQKSLCGDHGAVGTKRASDLLFFDIADLDGARRHCARRVLSEALGNLEISRNGFSSNLNGDFRWLVSLLETNHSDVILESLIPRLTSALFLERGDVLSAYIFALQYYDKTRVRGDDEGGKSSEGTSSSILFRLLSLRPNICSATMNRYPGLQDLMVRAVYKAFKDVGQEPKESNRDEDIAMFIRKDGENIPSEVHLPLTLLQAAIVLISNWQDDTKSAAKQEFKELTKFLIRAGGRHGSSEGAASAIFASTKQKAVSSEEWVSLATSSCSDIARESVRCAPNILLPRFLLCCGISEASFSLINERLDQLGDTSDDVDKVFSQLLTQNAIHQWRVGHNTKRSNIIKKLHGRVKAYMHFHDSSKVYSSFFTWLARQCREKRNDISKNSRKKKSNEQSKISVLDTVNGVCQGRDIAVLPDIQENGADNTLLHIGQSLSRYGEMSKNGTDIVTHIHASLKSNDFSKVEVLLEELYSTCGELFGKDLDNSDYCEKNILVAKELISWLQSSTTENDEDLNRILLRWVPLFSVPDPESLNLLFSTAGDLSLERKRIKSSLVFHCLAAWSKEEIQSCQTWATERLRAKAESKYWPKLLMRCFLQQSSFTANGSMTKIADSTGLNLPYTFIQLDDAEHITRLALLAAEEWSNFGCQPENWRSEDWMTLILLVGSQGEDHLAKVVSTIFVDKYQLSQWSDTVLPRILLNLYANFPTKMSLSNPNIREMLINASAKLHHEWLAWSNPIDDQILSAIQNIRITTLQTQQQLVIDFIKKYPLFAIKHTKALLQVLKENATSNSSYDIERGRRSVQYPSLVATTDVKLVQISVVHWGCSFSEPLWIAVLDILLGFPDKVIFSCGHLMGLLDVLNMYLLLLKTQIEVGNYRKAPTDIVTTNRIRNKFSNIVQNFSKANYEAFADWVTSSKVESQEVGDLLILCKIPIE